MPIFTGLAGICLKFSKAADSSQIIDTN